jgi:hypothetical protein
VERFARALRAAERLPPAFPPVREAGFVPATEGVRVLVEGLGLEDFRRAEGHQMLALRVREANDGLRDARRLVREKLRPH